MNGSATPYVSVVLPAFNEAKSIVATLNAMRTFLDVQPYACEIIVSADGNDGTRELASEQAKSDPRIFVIGTAQRGGKGKGVRDGMLMARGEVIGFIDADYKTPIDELEKLLPHFKSGCDVVIGSRRAARAMVEVAQPLYRRLGSRAFAFVMHLMLGLNDIQDTQCGFKFFTRQAAREVFSRQKIDGYMFDVEILRISKALGLRIEQVGVRWRDDNDSRYQVVLGTLRNARELMRIRFLSIEPRK